MELACPHCSEHFGFEPITVLTPDSEHLAELFLGSLNCVECPQCHATLSAQIQLPIQRMYCVNAPAKVKKMALLMSSYSPGVYDGAVAEFRDICNYWKVENMGFVSAKIDEQKTDATLSKIQALVEKL